MSKENREKTDIVVKVIDFSKFIAEEEKAYRETYDLPEAKITVSEIGFIQVGDDKYLLDTDGVIQAHPISKDNTFSVGFNVNIGNKIKFEYAEVTLEDTRNVKKEVNLADFIRKFGSRLEYNYHNVIEHIKEQRNLIRA